MTARLRNRTKGIAATIVAVGALAVGLGASGSATADGGAKSWIKFTKLESSGAKGKVTSGRGSCEGKGRKISVFRYEGFVSDKVAITYTNAEGKWKVGKDLKDGKYFSKVDHSPGCRYAVSRNKWIR